MGSLFIPRFLKKFPPLIVKNSAHFNILGWDGWSGEGGEGANRMEEGREWTRLA